MAKLPAVVWCALLVFAACGDPGEAEPPVEAAPACPSASDEGFSFDVPVVIAAGHVTVNGYPSGASLNLHQGDHSVHLGQGMLLAPVVPGVYSLRHHAVESPAPGMPQNRNALIASEVAIDGSRWLGVDIRTVQVYVRATIRGEALDLCPLALTTPDGDEVPLRCGWNTLIPGRYDVEYRRPSPTGDARYPYAARAVVREDVDLGEGTLLDVDVPVADIVLAPAGLEATEYLTVFRDGRFVSLHTRNGPQAMRVVPGAHDVKFGSFAGGFLSPFLVTRGADLVEGTRLDVAPPLHRVSLPEAWPGQALLADAPGSAWVRDPVRVPAATYQLSLLRQSGEGDVVQAMGRVVIDADGVLAPEMPLTTATFQLAGAPPHPWQLQLEGDATSATLHADGATLTAEVPPGRYRGKASFGEGPGAPLNQGAVVFTDLELGGTTVVSVATRRLVAPVRFVGPAPSSPSETWTLRLEGRDGEGTVVLVPDAAGKLDGHVLEGTYDVVYGARDRSAPAANPRAVVGCVVVR